jgi:hypothetical protein
MWKLHSNTVKYEIENLVGSIVGSMVLFVGLKEYQYVSF